MSFRIVLSCLALSLFLYCSLSAAELVLSPHSIPGVTEDDIESFCSDMIASNISCSISIYRFSPSLPPAAAISIEDAHKLSDMFLPCDSTTIKAYSAGELYTLLVHLAIGYGGDNMLLHMRTLKRIFTPVAPNELEDWQAFIISPVGTTIRGKSEPGSFYFFVNPENERVVYVKVSKSS